MQDMTWRGFSNVKRARFADIKTELRLLQMQLRNRWNQHLMQICLKIIPESFLTNKHSRFLSIALLPTSTWGRCNPMTQLSPIPSFMWEDAFGSSSNCYCVQVLLCLIWCFPSRRWLPSPFDSSSYKQQSHSTITMRQPPKLQIRENQLVEI